MFIPPQKLVGLLAQGRSHWDSETGETFWWSISSWQMHSLPLRIPANLEDPAERQCVMHLAGVTGDPTFVAEY